MIEFDVKGIREAITTIGKLDKTLVKDLRLDIAMAARPMVNAIRSNIPTSAPIRGFNHQGRTGWPKTQPRITTSLNTSRTRRGLQRSTVRVVIKNAGVEIADMAGKTNKIRSGMSRAYVKKNTRVIQRHKLNNQGKYMIEALNQTGYGRASRYVYPAVDRFKPTIEANIEKTIAAFIINSNQELMKRVG